MPEGVPGKGDADIIAFKDGEMVHVECMAWWGPGIRDENEAFEWLNSKFERAQDTIFKRYGFLERYGPIIKIFVTGGRADNPRPNGPWNRLQEFCGKEGIELIEINTIVEDLIRELRRENPGPLRVGVKGIARFLLHLIQNDFLIRPQE